MGRSAAAAMLVSSVLPLLSYSSTISSAYASYPVPCCFDRQYFFFFFFLVSIYFHCVFFFRLKFSNGA